MIKKISSIVARYAAHPVVKGSAIMFGGTMLANVLAYLYHLVVGRILGPVGYGELAALLSIFYILNAPATVLQNILVKFFSRLKAKNDYGQAKQLLFGISRSVFLVEIGFFVLLVPFIPALSAFLRIEDRLNLIWLYLMFASFVFSIVNMSALQAFQLFFPLSVVVSLGGLLRLVFGAVGALFGVGWTLFSNVLASLIAYVATFLPLRGLLAHKARPITISPSSALYYSIPVFISILSITALFSQDVVLVKHFFSAREAGLYSSLSVLGKIIFFASASLAYVAFPVLAERKELGKPYGKIVFLSLVLVAGMSFGVTLLYFVFPSFVVNLLFGKAFEGASGLLGQFGLFISFYTLSNLFTSMYLALGKTGVWVLTALAAVIQAIVITVSHGSLSIVIVNNALVAAGLFIALLLYYPYAKSRD